MLSNKQLSYTIEVRNEASRFVAGNDERGYALWMEVAYRHDSGLPEAEIRKFIHQQPSNDAPMLGPDKK